MNSWGSRTKQRYKGLQLALNRPFRNGLMLKGAYTLSEAKNMADEDGWAGLTWNHPIKYDDNFALAGYDRTHVAQLGFLYELPFLRDHKSALGKILGGWQLNGIGSFYSGTPYSIGGTNNALNCQGCGSVLINFVGRQAGADRRRGLHHRDLLRQVAVLAADRPRRQRLRDQRAQPVPPAERVERGPGRFKSFQVGRVRPEIRIEVGERVQPRELEQPGHDLHRDNFLQFIPNADSGSERDRRDRPGPDSIQLGLRLQF